MTFKRFAFSTSIIFEKNESQKKIFLKKAHTQSDHYVRIFSTIVNSIFFSTYNPGNPPQ